uniref:Derlin n=1 Tax=Neobodo designis TaxID=312471 RepID=A0A7S1LXG8_NEODS
MAQSFEAWWASLGAVTKFVLVTTVGLSIGMKLGLFAPPHVVVDFDATLFRLEVWRLVTALFFLGPPSFPWLFNVAMLVMYTQRQEEDHAGRTADLVWLFVLLGAALHVGAFLLALPVMSFALTMALLWVWCRRHEDAQLSLYMFQFKAATFPWVLLVFHLILGGSIVQDLVGIVCGHAYYFAADVLPKTHGTTLISTPGFVRRWFPNERMGAYTVHAPAAARPGGAMPAPGQPQRHQWGGGRALGN